MTQQAGRTLTMQDLAADYQWIRQLGWSDDDLRSVAVHEAAVDPGGEIVNLAAFGGTSLGVGGGASANAGSLPNMYVYRSETPDKLWQKLKNLSDMSGPSGYQGLVDEDKPGFPPSGNNG